MKKSVNYLEQKPERNGCLTWKQEENITLEIKNEGFFNKVAQKLFKKPPVSYVHLDEMGSFLWPLLDGDKSVEELGLLVDEKFGQSAYPLYERLYKYLKILESYNFITLK